MIPTDFAPLVSAQRPADAAAGERRVTLSVGRRGSLYRVLIHDSGASGKPEASAMDHTWQLALISARDRAGGRGIAADAAGAALLAEAMVACDAAMAALAAVSAVAAPVVAAPPSTQVRG